MPFKNNKEIRRKETHPQPSNQQMDAIAFLFFEFFSIELTAELEKGI
jgi:hypothetical protein